MKETNKSKKSSNKIETKYGIGYGEIDTDIFARFLLGIKQETEKKD